MLQLVIWYHLLKINPNPISKYNRTSLPESFFQWKSDRRHRSMFIHREKQLFTKQSRTRGTPFLLGTKFHPMAGKKLKKTHFFIVKNNNNIYLVTSINVLVETRNWTVGVPASTNPVDWTVWCCCVACCIEMYTLRVKSKLIKIPKLSLIKTIFKWNWTMREVIQN